MEDALGDDDELEEDAAKEVDKVLFELTAGNVLFLLRICVIRSALALSDTESGLSHSMSKTSN